MSFRSPSHVSATTGSDHQSSSGNEGACCNCQAITLSRTTPTLCVLVIITGPARNPDSSTQVVPVISPFPFSANHPANTGSTEFFPRGKIAVTPVRTGPVPTTNFPSPEIKVRYPTSTPCTSVIASNGPGVPSNGTPKSRARTSCSNPALCAPAIGAAASTTQQPTVNAASPARSVILFALIPSPVVGKCSRQNPATSITARR